MSTAVAIEDTDRLRRRIGWACAAVAAVLAAVAIGLAVSTLVYSMRSGEANGEVIALEEVRDEAGQVKAPAEYRLVIEYPDHNGQFRRFTEATTTTEPPAIGSEVKVLFDRRRPANARLEDLELLYHPAVVAGAWALGIGVVAEGLVRGARPRVRPGADAEE